MADPATGIVTWHAEDLPLLEGVTGAVVFTATVRSLSDASVPVTYFPRPVVAEFDNNGDLEVVLTATDDPDIQPQGEWAWKASFIELLDSNGHHLKFDPFLFFLPSNTTIDLTTVDHVDPTTLNPIVPPNIPAWFVALADETAARVAADEVLQDQIDLIDINAVQAETDRAEAAEQGLQDQIDMIIGSDVETVAGVAPVGGNVPASDLQTVLGIPADTTQDIADLQSRVTALEALLADLAIARSTDGSFGLSAPIGNGFEWVIVADEIDKPQYDGNPL